MRSWQYDVRASEMTWGYHYIVAESVSTDSGLALWWSAREAIDGGDGHFLAY